MSYEGLDVEREELMGQINGKTKFLLKCFTFFQTKL